MDKYYRKNDKVNGRFEIIKRIGEGRYGIVYLAKDDNGVKVVIKQLKKDMLKETRRKLFYEQKILRSLDNKAFPKFIGTFRDKFREGYILEYKEGKVLYDTLFKDDKKYTKDEIYEITDKILNLMEILHNNSIVHRDIRLPNIIINQNNELFLIDFGLARFINKRYKESIDYWYLGDFLIRLHYSAYESMDEEEKSWDEELQLRDEEKKFIKKLMGVNGTFNSIEEIKNELEKIRE